MSRKNRKRKIQDMKTLTKIFVVTLFFFVYCSSKSDVYLQLDQAKAFLRKNLVDSAVETIKFLEPRTSEDSAYFFLLKAECDYRQRKTPRTIDLDYCIAFYEKQNDFLRLANSYYYKCMVSVRTSSLSKEDIVLLKKAEQYAEKTSDYNLKDKVSTGLRFVNVFFGEYQEALKYAKNEYNYAKHLTKRDVAYSMLSLASVYRHLENKDSAEYYVLQCKRLSVEVDDNDKSYIYNLLGECFMNENNDAALSYFKTALNYRQLPEIYRNIAEVYYSRNDTLNQRLYCDSALVSSSYDLKIKILNDMALMYYNFGDYPKYKNTVERMFDVYNQRIAEVKETNALAIQKKYDFEKQQARFEKMQWIFVAVVCFFVAVVSVVVLFYKRNIYYARQKMQIIESDNAMLHQRLCATKEQIEEYREQIDYLINQNSELNADSDNMVTIIENNQTLINTLQTKLGTLNRQAEESLVRGGEIYTRMLNDESINDYKNRWSDCLFYFEAKFPDKLAIFSIYQNLTVSNMLFIICDEYLHKDDKQLSSIFDLSVSTVRSRRSKLKDKIS